MKTIGQILKSARDRKKLSLSKLEDLTKIKRGFINAIESEKWEDLPSFPTVLGFVKSISNTLGINEKVSVAVLKRDYPPKKTILNPKPDIAPKFTWSPRLTFALGACVVLVLIASYLIFQYSRFISAPKLEIDSPINGQKIEGSQVIIKGRTDPDALVTANNQPILIDQDGNFSIELEINDQTKEIIIKAISRSGKETIESRKIDTES